jgi:predicted nucleic acid-binding protein
MDIVVDASIIIAVIANEPSKASLVQLTSGTNLVAPGSLPWEIGNAFSAMLKRRRLSLDQVQQALTMYQQIPLRFLEIDLSQALEIADQYQLYAYDAYLLVCALQQQAPLLTLDRGLRHVARLAQVTVMEVSP